MKKITELEIQEFEDDLYLNEKSRATVKKYVNAVRKLADYLDHTELT